MPVSRDPRMDRRRRVLRETSEIETPPPNPSNRARRNSADESQEPVARRSAGYSQNVRNACGHRLVQLIPIRRRSYAAAVAVSFCVPALLLVAHYMIYVSGSWPWWGHPMAVAFDASHPQGIAAWLSSHLWLLCLAATLLTFQLRRHKLDDYNGEYRLWFWLVVTCLIASIDSTTHISELFGLALDKWSQLNLGWSGPAVVKSTLAVLIGMLGLRLCTELKSVPTSLVFWLGGLVAWAASAALGQEELKIELSVQFRIWLKCALWLGGLTAIWVAALSYLRTIYIEAQRRFLLRSALAAASSVPLGQRIRESLPSMPSMPAFRRQRSADDDATEKTQRSWKVPSLRRTAKQEAISEQFSEPLERKAASVVQATSAGTAQNDKSAKTAVAAKPAREDLGQAAAAVATRRGLGGFLGRKSSAEGIAAAEPRDTAEAKSRAGLRGWFRKAKDDDQALEYRKLREEKRAQAREQAELKRAERQATKAARRSAKSSDQPSLDQPTAGRSRGEKPQDGKQPAGKQHREKSGVGNEGEDDTSRRGWMPKLGKPKLPAVKIPKVGKPSGRWISKLKVPSFGLSSLRLQPPADSDAAGPPPQTPTRAIPANRPLPGTAPQHDDEDDYEEEDSGRSMSKAERKRLRRQQQQDRAA